MRTYLVLSRIVYRGANAQPAWWCSAAPGPMAFAGFGHALARAVGAVDAWRGIGIVHHDHRLRAERLPLAEPQRAPRVGLFPHQHRGAALIGQKDYPAGSHSLSSQPTIRSDGIVSLVLAFDEGTRLASATIADFLRRARIAGGTIARHRFNDRRDWIASEWKDVPQMLGSGHVFVDRSDRLACRGDEDPLDAFLRATRRFRPKERAHGDKAPHEAAARAPAAPARSHDAERASWLTPYTAGYRAITPIESRGWSRDGWDHAFVEPLVGLGQMQPLRALAAQPIPLWNHVHTAQAPDLFLVRPTGGAAL